MPSSQDLKKIAALACIDLNTASAASLAKDVDAILKFVEQLHQVNTEGISPLFHPLNLKQRLRLDEVNEPDRSQELAKIAPLFTDNLYLVPKVIEPGK
ncbi:MULTISPECIES: Asp-tRNA(Asn)/Glu-tRNA(Gln) amidotransferase subunit GatC [Legionella]|nr:MULTISPECIES: Asp-tRNA(Asn)/Glu-tRNA(Gln) amidotransferase subunit GatC [Legionella]